MLGWSLLCVTFCSCKKSVEEPGPIEHPAKDGFIQYTIRAGEQYCDRTTYMATDYSALTFVVKFDSSAIYQTRNVANQPDVNKLYGFADNNAGHQQFSARFGWRWSDGALRLFGYTYNNGIRDFLEIGIIEIGQEYTCTIAVAKEVYIFSVGNTRKNMQRSSTSSTATGYKLYPYFGGDETAPHDIRIWIKEL